jgi:DNA repair protein RecO (recombination protein O)
MRLSAPAIVVAARAHGETGVIARLLTAEHGLVAAYVAGGRGRQLRPVLIPGNTVAAEISARSDSQLPFAKVELLHSRGPYLAEPLPAAAITWATALAAAVLPERHAYPALHGALGGLLDAVCGAPSARGWVPGLVGYEGLMLRELGYGNVPRPPADDWSANLAALDALAPLIERYLLADRRGDVMGARNSLRERLARIG